MLNRSFIVRAPFFCGYKSTAIHVEEIDALPLAPRFKASKSLPIENHAFQVISKCVSGAIYRSIIEITALGVSTLDFCRNFACFCLYGPHHDLIRSLICGKCSNPRLSNLRDAYSPISNMGYPKHVPKIVLNALKLFHAHLGLS